MDLKEIKNPFQWWEKHESKFPIRVKTHYEWTICHHFSPKKMMHNKFNRCVVN
jgi:hypothetical protein